MIGSTTLAGFALVAFGMVCLWHAKRGGALYLLYLAWNAIKPGPVRSWSRAGI
ncbi:MAG: hypothetical protein JWO51_5231 [Rhodospirillales bacterium]|nr:hypothetical protein [Rhodospirillales bacterium]